LLRSFAEKKNPAPPYAKTSFPLAKIAQYTAFRGPMSTYHSLCNVHPVEKAARQAEATAGARSLERFRYRAAGLWPHYVAC
jgi:hypothetical protein